MDISHHFPFSQKLEKVEQKDRSPKKAFILGVYASAVHATWIDSKGKIPVRSLAVASDPEIFWRVENTAEILKEILIPEELGKLTVPHSMYNGPSGKVAGDQYELATKLDELAEMVYYGLI